MSSMMRVARAAVRHIIQHIAVSSCFISLPPAGSALVCVAGCSLFVMALRLLLRLLAPHCSLHVAACLLLREPSQHSPEAAESLQSRSINQRLVRMGRGWSYLAGVLGLFQFFIERTVRCALPVFHTRYPQPMLVVRDSLTALAPPACGCVLCVSCRPRRFSRWPTPAAWCCSGRTGQAPCNPVRFPPLSVFAHPSPCLGLWL